MTAKPVNPVGRRHDRGPGSFRVQPHLEYRGRAGATDHLLTRTTDSLRLSLEVPRRAALGQGGPVALVVTNVGKRPTTLYLQGDPIAFDMQVSRPDESVVWQRLSGHFMAAILQVKMLGPGETLRLVEVWKQRDQTGAAVEPGTYRVEGRILTDREPLRFGPSNVVIGKG